MKKKDMTELKPKKTKFGRRKFQKGIEAPKGRNNRTSSCNESIYGDKVRSSGLSFGKFGIKIVASGKAPSLSFASPIIRSKRTIPEFPPGKVSHQVNSNPASHPAQVKKEGTIRISAEELQSLHQDVSRRIKALSPAGGNQIWLMAFPDIGVSSKPAEVKMGKSKGSVSYWCAHLYPGSLLFEIDGVSEEIAKEARRFIEKKTRFKLCLHKEDGCL